MFAVFILKGLKVVLQSKLECGARQRGHEENSQLCRAFGLTWLKERFYGAYMEREIKGGVACQIITMFISESGGQ